MKQCLACGNERDSQLMNCKNCAYVLPVIDGFEIHAPSLAKEGGGFKASYFSQLVQLEEASFWFRSRSALIFWALRKYAPSFKSILEVGCGTGFVLSGIARTFPTAVITGSEIFIEGLRFAARRLPASELLQMDARQIPFVDEFDVVGAFDVLEHIEEDGAVLVQLFKALKLGGIALISVPQHTWLWSSVDEYAMHQRRYSDQDLKLKLQKAGFKVLRSTSFVSLLLPAMMLTRAMQRSGSDKIDPTKEFVSSRTSNLILERVLSIERLFIRMGLNFPFGGSRFVVASKPE